jgi:hypothetical protein
MVPWALGSAVLAGLLVAVAGGGWRGGAVVGLLGLVFAGFAAVTSRARCPACGGSLAALAGERPGRGGPAPSAPRRCPRCRIAFD